MCGHNIIYDMMLSTEYDKQMLWVLIRITSMRCPFHLLGFYVPLTAKVIPNMVTGPRFKVSSERMEKP